MSKQEPEIKIRDKRKPGFFQIDNEVLDVHGKAIGVYGFSVYGILSRYSYSSEKCSLSLRKIADILGMSPASVMRSVATLKEYGLISVEEESLPGQPNKAPVYVLLDVKACFCGEHRVSVVNTTVSVGNTGVSQGNTNKEEEVFKKVKNNPCEPATQVTGGSELFTLTPSEPEELSLHKRVENLIKALYEQKNRMICPWGPAEAKLLSQLLKDYTSHKPEDWERCVRNVYRSDAKFYSMRPRVLLAGKLLDFSSGPRDQYGNVEESQPVSAKPQRELSGSAKKAMDCGDTEYLRRMGYMQ